MVALCQVLRQILKLMKKAKSCPQDLILYCSDCKTECLVKHANCQNHLRVSASELGISTSSNSNVSGYEASVDKSEKQ